MGALNPAYLGRFRGGARKPLVFRASPGTLPASPLFIRVSDVPTRIAFIHAGFRKVYPQMPYPRGVPGIFLCAFDHDEAPRPP